VKKRKGETTTVKPAQNNNNGSIQLNEKANSIVVHTCKIEAVQRTSGGYKKRRNYLKIKCQRRIKRIKG
jgi:hypothetical protein